MSEKTSLTELEGAVLTEIGYRGNETSFKVRRAFELSPSSSWSGSAGAVYPAIKRLVAAGLVRAHSISSKRGTRTLALTPAGQTLLQAWIRDAETACSIGVDPFRLRIGLWQTLTPEAQRDVADAMTAAVNAELAKLEQRGVLDPVEHAGNLLAIRSQALRLQWLDEWRARLGMAQSRDATVPG